MDMTTVLPLPVAILDAMRNRSVPNSTPLLPYLRDVVVVLGGVSAVLWFLWRRQVHPRARIEHDVFRVAITPSKVLVSVTVSIKNRGNTLLRVKHGYANLYQIEPWPPDLLEAIRRDTDPVAQRATEFFWPRIGTRMLHLKGPEILGIEPGEEDQVRFDFFVDARIEKVFVYTHFDNTLLSIRERLGHRFCAWLLPRCRRTVLPALRQIRKEKSARRQTDHAFSDGIVQPLWKRKMMCNLCASVRRRIRQNLGLGWNTITPYDLTRGRKLTHGDNEEKDRGQQVEAQGGSQDVDAQER